MSIRNFQTYAVHTSDEVKDGNGKTCYAWIVPAKLSAFRYINNLGYVEGERTPESCERQIVEG